MFKVIRRCDKELGRPVVKVMRRRPGASQGASGKGPVDSTSVGGAAVVPHDTPGTPPGTSGQVLFSARSNDCATSVASWPQDLNAQLVLTMTTWFFSGNRTDPPKQSEPQFVSLPALVVSA